MTNSVDLKALYPQCTEKPFCELKYDSEDNSITMWVGKRYDHCEEHWSIIIKQCRQHKFEVPGIPYHFMLVSGKIYYRKNGLIG